MSGRPQSVAHVFETQLRQYQLLLKILAVTVVAGGAVTLLVSKLLTRKLRAVVPGQPRHRRRGSSVPCHGPRQR